MTTTTDPRPFYDRTLNWVHALVTAVRPDQLDGATPCGEFDVRALLGHLVATVDRARAIAEDRPPFSVPSVVTGVTDDAWGAALAGSSVLMQAAWSDDALLDKAVTVPWGTVSGRAAVWGYLNEALVHGWDLAVATDQDPEAEAELATVALVGARENIPAEVRGDGVPFGPVVTSGPAAGPTERLANWSGHRRG